MSKMTNATIANREAEKEVKDMTTKKAVTNYMGGTSYEINPLDTLKMVSASSIFGEPQYYRDGEFAEKGVKDGVYSLNPLFKLYSVLSADFNNKKTSEIMESAIDASLSYDFKATLEWARELRRDFYMRLNPHLSWFVQLSILKEQSLQRSILTYLLKLTMRSCLVQTSLFLS